MQIEMIKGFRLSLQQRRVWLLGQKTGALQAVCALLFEGALDPEKLKATLGEIVERHQILHTGFQRRPGTKIPLQVINEGHRFFWEEIDLRGMDDVQQETELEKRFREQHSGNFDPERESLLRAGLIRRSDERHVLLVGLPSLCADSGTLQNLAQEIARGYAGEERDEAAETSEPIQYIRFSKWQNELLEDEEDQAGKEFWQKQDLLSVEQIPLPLTSAADEALFQPESISVAIEPPLVDRISAIARRHDVSLNAFTLACWQVLLWRYTGQTDVLVGTAHDGRESDELEGALGLLTKYIPLRARLAEGQRFDDLLGQLHETMDEALEWQDYFSWEQIEEAAGDGHELPTYTQFNFDYEERPESYSVAGGLTMRVLKQHVCVEPFSLRLSCVKRGATLRAEFHYNAARLDAAYVKRIAANFQTLLENVSRQPEAVLGRLPILSPDESRELLTEFNETAADHSAGQLIHQLFEQHAHLTPERTAVVYEDTELTYAELNARANQLARYLRKQGVGPEVAVGLLLERSADVVVGLLGILKAGGAYVPLEPTYPSERLNAMLEDSGVKVVLVHQRGAVAWPVDGTGQLVSFDTDWEKIALESSEDVDNHTTAENLAYVIYTSGSSGKPKGVAVEQRQLLNYLHSITKRMGLGDGASFATVSTFAADLGHTCVFPALCDGGTLHIISQERVSDADALAEYFDRHPVDCLKIVPSHLSALLSVARPERILPRRQLVLGGEASPWSLIEKTLGYAPQSGILNHYGPTEATVGVLTYRVSEASHPYSETVPLGRPLDNAQVYLLNPSLQPVPLGVAGELHIGGAGLARGYLNRPELSAEKFIPDPFAKTGGARLYKTGDLARLLPDGQVEFLGRADNQVKIRGFRIELGEIEAALAKHSAVRQNVVMAREDVPGDKRLVAYIVPDQKYTSTLSSQRLHRLPNNLSIFHINKNEAEHLYREIFEDQLYLKHGITLRDGDCVFDVGANIGLFTLFTQHKGRDLRVYAFEPNPAAFEKLRGNVERYGLDVNLFECGLSNKDTTATYTYYPQASVMSGFYPDLAEEKRLFKSFMLNQELKGGEAEKTQLAEYADELTEARFESESFTCQLRTISHIISENKIDSIDLLKIDVEKSEVDVLEGIKPEDWPKIKQIVIEVHDIEHRFDETVALLEGHGFQIKIDELVVETGVYNIFARRERPDDVAPVAEAHVTPDRVLSVVNNFQLTGGELRNYLKEKLPAYMVPTAVVLLERMPLTPNGKLDRRALPAPEQYKSELGSEDIAPRTPVEEILASLWAEVLRVERVSIHDNFFEIGGHSLLATQLISRIREAFGLELPLRSLFESPTVAQLSEQVERIRQSVRGTAPLPALSKASREGELPLSFAQQRLWFLDQLTPGSSSYNGLGAIHLSGSLKTRALEQSIGEIIRRHEVLRTTFSVVDGQPHQVISPDAPFSLPIIDLTHLDEAEREPEARVLAATEAQRPFDLSQGPLLRVSLLRLDDEEHVLLVTMHHIISDGWSLGIFTREVGQLYEAYSRGAASPLEELPIQYADYAVWQRDYLQGEVLEQQLGYWKQQLAGAPQVLELLTDYPRPPVQSYRGASQHFQLSAELSERLKRLSQQQGVTLFMTLLAAFQTLLMRYSGQRDITVGTPIAGRTRGETEALIGFFVNTLVLRTELDEEWSFRELLGRVKEVCLGAYAHQEVPFEKLVEELAPEREMSRSPLFQVMLVLQNAPQEAGALEGLELRGVEGENQTAKFDLMLAMGEADGGLTGALQYNTDLFAGWRMQRMVEHFERLLEAVVREPEQHLNRVEILSEAERHEQLVEWNDTSREYVEQSAAIHQLFEAQVARTPDALAVTYETDQLSYQQLNERANQLAHYLRTLGVGPETRVGVMMERSVEMVVALLGILKAGGAYVPLDVSYPPERLSFMIEDAELRLVISQQTLVERFAPTVRETVDVLSLDAQWEEVAQHSRENLALRVEADNTAYVIYTSGSTGQPKGVAIPHRAICNHMRWMQERFPLTAADSVLQKTPFSFDASVWEFYAPLLTGAQLVMARPGGHRDGAYLTSVMAEQQVTILQVVPGLLTVLVEDEGLSACRSLRRVFCGGEALTAQLVEAFRERVQSAGMEVELVNLYGPTEACIDTTCWVNKYAVSKGRNGDGEHDLTIHELFEAQVERTPDALAVIFEEEQVTYRQLNERANQLAHYLRAQGVGPETLVGVMMERCVELVVALLGVLKAGAAYVPLDVSYPQERLSFMVQDAALRLVISQQRVLPQLDALAAALAADTREVLSLDTQRAEIERHSRENLSVRLQAQNAAYVIYTSGSTGRPKGAMNTHAGIRNRLLWMQEAYGLTGSDRVLQKTPFSFDVSVWEFFWPLMTGACLVVAIPEGHGDAAYLVRLIREQEITTLHFVPSMLSQFLEEQGVGECRSLRRVICSGEALSWELKERFFGVLHTELHNLYGPTEAAVDVTSWACEQGNSPAIVPIGRPIANTQLYIVDGRQEMVPVGVAGELCIGGAGLARGYLGRAELTAEKFIPNPYSREAGARLYRTGDLVRYLAGGELEYLGRIDQQVKVRGFRIELGEIEAAISAHSAVRECVVIVREDVPGDKRLVAYLVAAESEGSEQLSVNELRAGLKQRLPEYMVPQAFVLLDRMPVTPNGKLDRRALPAPEQSRAELAHEYVAPRTPIEEMLCGIWSAVLRVEEVGVHDNFFELGGHSLLATQLVSRIREAFAVELPLRSLFESPTISKFAELIEKAKENGAETQAPSIVRVSRDSYRAKRSVVEQQKR